MLSKDKTSVDIKSDEYLEDEAYKILRIILDELGYPVEVNRPMFKNAIKKRLRTHFGPGRTGLEKFREYCLAYAKNAFLMGKQVMKSGDRFVTSVGSILAEWMIESYWRCEKFFRSYLPAKRNVETLDSKNSEHSVDVSSCEQEKELGSDNGFSPNRVCERQGEDLGSIGSGVKSFKNILSTLMSIQPFKGAKEEGLSMLKEEEGLVMRKEEILLDAITLEDILRTAKSSYDRQVKQKLFNLWGDVTYQAWFHTKNFVAKGLDRLGDPIFDLSSNFCKEYVLDHYKDQLKKAFTSSISLEVVK